jgi:hypothetical protein
MRIIGTLPHPYVKITVFAMNMRYSVKFEMGQMEQTFKIRESEEINSIEDISRLVDDELIDECMETFTIMHKSMERTFQRFAEPK